MIWPFRTKTPPPPPPIDPDTVDLDQVECADLRERIRKRRAVQLVSKNDIRLNRIAQFRAWNKGLTPEEVEARREAAAYRPRWLQILHAVLAWLATLCIAIVLLPLVMVLGIYGVLFFQADNNRFDGGIIAEVISGILAPLLKIPRIGKYLYTTFTVLFWIASLALWAVCAYYIHGGRRGNYHSDTPPMSLVEAYRHLFS